MLHHMIVCSEPNYAFTTLSFARLPIEILCQRSRERERREEKKKGIKEEERHGDRENETKQTFFHRLDIKYPSRFDTLRFVIVCKAVTDLPHTSTSSRYEYYRLEKYRVE